MWSGPSSCRVDTQTPPCLPHDLSTGALQHAADHDLILYAVRNPVVGASRSNANLGRPTPVSDSRICSNCSLRPDQGVISTVARVEF